MLADGMGCVTSLHGIETKNIISDGDIQFLRSSGFSRAVTGVGESVGHHGEIVQGGLRGVDGRIRRFLVTMPCPLTKSTASFTPSVDGDLTVFPAWKSKAWRAARLTLEFLGEGHSGGSLEVVGTAVPELGMGSSTSDVVAAITAVSMAFGYHLSREAIARLAVSAEGACDSVMFDELVLFAQREGAVIERLHGRLPAMLVLGFVTEENGKGLATDILPLPDYSASEVSDFLPLLGALRAAIRMQDIALLGRAATVSATINQRYFPKAHFETYLGMLRRYDVAGLQVSHSGTVAGFLFPSETRHTDQALVSIRSELLDLGITHSYLFRV